MDPVVTWMRAHPAHCWLIVTACLTIALKPRTPAEYASVARFSPRLAALLQLVGALGLDPVKVVKVLRKLVSPPGSSDGADSLPPPPTKSGLPRIMRAALAGVVLLATIGTAGCALFTRENAKSVLDASQLACVFNSTIAQEEKLASICNIAKELIPLLRDLIGQREAARKSGVHWPGSDAGVAAADAGADGGK